MTVAVLTNAPAENIRVVDSVLGLENWFDPARIVSGDELARAAHAPKPAADDLDVLAERLGVTCDACIYVRDSIADFAAARGASMTAVGDARGGRAHLAWVVRRFVFVPARRAQVGRAVPRSAQARVTCRGTTSRECRFNRSRLDAETAAILPALTPASNDILRL